MRYQLTGFPCRAINSHSAGFGKKDRSNFLIGFK